MQNTNHRGSILWTTVRKNVNRTPIVVTPNSSQPSTVSLAPPNPNATSLRLLLTRTESSLETFSSNISTLVAEVSEAKEAVLATNSNCTTFEQTVTDRLRDTACQTETAITRNFTSIEDVLQKVASGQKLIQDRLGLLETYITRIDARSRENDERVANLQMKMQSLASRDHELRKELAALPQILPAVQAIPLYIENAVINITNKLVLNQADLEQRLPSESLKGSQRSPRILPPGNTTMPTNISRFQADPGPESPLTPQATPLSPPWDKECPSDSEMVKTSVQVNMKSIPKANEELGSRSATDRNGKGRQHAHKPDTVARKRRKVEDRAAELLSNQ